MDKEEILESKEEILESKEEMLESMDHYSEEIEASLRKIHVGDVMECTVTAIDENAVSVDLDYYAPGRILPVEMSADPLFNVLTDVQIGDQFKAVVRSADDGAGNILLSKKEADKEFAWEKLEQMKTEKTVISGTVSGVVNSGAVFYVEGIRGFIPASKLDLKYVKDTNPYLGKRFRFGSRKWIKTGKLILSARELDGVSFREEKAEYEPAFHRECGGRDG